MDCLFLLAHSSKRAYSEPGYPMYVPSPKQLVELVRYGYFRGLRSADRLGEGLEALGRNVDGTQLLSATVVRLGV
eukprot:638868-Pyramimonas_sp.AAC.1